MISATKGCNVRVKCISCNTIFFVSEKSPFLLDPSSTNNRCIPCYKVGIIGFEVTSWKESIYDYHKMEENNE